VLPFSGSTNPAGTFDLYAWNVLRVCASVRLHYTSIGPDPRRILDPAGLAFQLPRRRARRLLLSMRSARGAATLTEMNSF
jgi:hypothetical protein